MARDVYVEPGRVVETMNEDGHTDSAILHELHHDPASSITAVRHDLGTGQYHIIADVTEATTTRRDKLVRTMMSLAQAASSIQAPTLGQAALLMAIRNMDGAGIRQFQTYAHKLAVQIGLDEMTPEEKEQVANAQKTPGPDAAIMNAQAQAIQAKAGKLAADTQLSQAKAVQALAQAQFQTRKADAPPPAAAHPAGSVVGAAFPGVQLPGMPPPDQARPWRPLAPHTLHAIMMGDSADSDDSHQDG